MRPRIDGATARLLSHLPGDTISDTISNALDTPPTKAAIMETIADWEFPGESQLSESRPRISDDVADRILDRQEEGETNAETISRVLSPPEWGGIDVMGFEAADHGEPYVDSVAAFAEWYDQPRPPSAWDLEVWLDSLASDYKPATRKRHYYAVKAYFRYEIGEWDVHEPTDRDTLVRALRDLADRLDKTPTSRDVHSDGDTPGIHEYQDEFGTWNAALEAAGLQPNETKPENFTDDELLDDLREFADSTGGVPTSSQMIEDGPHSISTYYNRFGGWVAALDAAGLDVRDRYGDRPEIEG